MALIPQVLRCLARMKRLAVPPILAGYPADWFAGNSFVEPDWARTTGNQPRSTDPVSDSHLFWYDMKAILDALILC